ncbi:MAG: hypothetical protein M3Q69_04740 [Acidobacteriota bacterium]|nr:hypothetical protein [Acidobacteriota bacterium]
MLAYGADRFRVAGERIILLSKIPKGWTPRVAKTLTTSEHPGTAVLWDEQYYEVVEASAVEGGGVRYVLAPWRDEHAFRTVERYDEQAENRRLDDFRLAQKQRAASRAARFSGMLLGHLPAREQERLQNELGVTPSRMTMLSAIPPLILFAICASIFVNAMIEHRPSPVPLVLFLAIAAFGAESFVRLLLAMSQSRGFGSFFGTLFYLATHRAEARSEMPRGTPRNSEEPEELRVADALTFKGPLLTLLSRDEQRRLAARHGYDYRRHAFGVAWVILVFALLGAVTSYANAWISFVVASVVAIEQIVRLIALRRGAAPSMFAILARPLVRDLLRDPERHATRTPSARSGSSGAGR